MVDEDVDDNESYCWESSCMLLLLLFSPNNWDKGGKGKPVCDEDVFVESVLLLVSVKLAWIFLIFIFWFMVFPAVAPIFLILLLLLLLLSRDLASVFSRAWCDWVGWRRVEDVDHVLWNSCSQDGKLGKADPSLPPMLMGCDDIGGDGGGGNKLGWALLRVTLVLLEAERGLKSRCCFISDEWYTAGEILVEFDLL